MKWIIIKQIEAAAKKSDKVAISISKKHWWQVFTATKQELIKGYLDGKVDIWGQYCALCKRFGDDWGNCGNCPLKDVNTGCCREWEIATELWTPEDGHRWKHRAFQKAAKVMYKRLCNLSSK
ncbi:hypothetical protein LCGC14_1066840 [marine sediment metagenome]|uniref:Uncharacterized protein n=1 Tax=marine sediment metagenome TaxID=412755 RepID=A0A0F9QQ90_9ZZZZ